MPAEGLAEGGQSFNGDERSNINLITWVFTVINIVAIAFVVGHKMYSQRRKWPNIDELILLFTLLLDFIQAAASAWVSNTGLGSDVQHLSEQSLFKFQTAGYFKSMFYLAIITTVKISVLRSLRELTPQKPHRLLTRMTKILVSLCAISSILALSFMCSFPHPWIFMGDKKCINRAALWIFVAIWDILTDLSIVVMPFVFLRTLHISRTERALCLTVFGIRLLCVPSSIFHAVSAVTLMHTTNFTDATFNVAISAQIQFLITILSTTFLHLSILVEPLERAYLAAVTQHPERSLRMSWPLKNMTPLAPIRLKSKASNSDTNSLIEGKAPVVDDTGLAPLGSTTGRASRASHSAGSTVREESYNRSRGRGDEELMRDTSIVKLTKEWTVSEVRR